MSGAYVIFDDPKRIADFKAFLAARGCDVLAPTNEWELLRFKAAGSTNVVYTNSRKTLSVVGPHIGPAAAAFVSSQAWRPEPKPVAPGSKKKARLIETLLQRDGDECFYCGKPLGDDCTLEHLIPLTQRGPNNTFNCVLAHKACNASAGHLTIIGKVRLREKLRAAP